MMHKKFVFRQLRKTLWEKIKDKIKENHSGRKLKTKFRMIFNFKDDFNCAFLCR